ncbi:MULTISPECIES: VOC family protein [Catenuloplanes]|uniref:Glyoxylase I family protein n=1 Tax=Catenuloplanes niger TaxID=587534 RepID=A0AAE3ZX89_9ACTN|nr:VOC family protein [Catenuloplanes niger]MDR7327577.1 glyoxylase I family protein [Catenuloplanes niger]
MSATDGRPVLAHVALLSPDIDRSLRFYRDGLGFTRTYGWRETATPEGEVVYRGRGVLVELGGGSYLEFLLGDPGAGTGPVHHIAVAVDDVDAAYARCLAAGGEPVVDGDWRGDPVSVHIKGDPRLPVRDAFVRGPSGEVVELYRPGGPIPVS